MARSFEVDELALVAFAAVVLLKFGDVVEGGDAVVAPVQEEAGGEVFGWKLGAGATGLGFFGGGETVVLDAFGGGIDDGGVGGDGGGLEVEAFGVLLVTLQGRSESEMAAGAPSHDDDALGVDADDGGVLFQEADRHADVFHRFERIGAVLVEDAVFDGDGHATAGGKVMAVGDELGGHGGIPEAAVQEKNAVEVGGFGVVSLGEIKVSGERALGGLVVNIGMCVLKELAITSFAEGRGLLKLWQRRHIPKKCGREWGSLSIVSRIMKSLFPISLAATLILGLLAPSLSAQNQLQPLLERTYNQWRQAIMTKNASRWSQTTSTRRQVEMRNRIFSERRPFPASLFALPTAPPDLRGLTPVRMEAKGPTAKAVYFGKVNFGVGGQPTDNLLILSFVQESGWKYDGADFITLAALPEVRAALVKGDYSILDKEEFRPDGAAPRPPAIQLGGAVPYIAKVYCYCPGREVTVQVNRRSRHSIANNQAAEVVIGGAVPGENQIEYSIKSLPGSTGDEPLAIRVYVMSEKQGVKIPAVFEYLVPEGGKPKRSGKGTFNLDPAMAEKLR